MTLWRQLPENGKARGSSSLGGITEGSLGCALPPVPHSWVLLQGGAQSCDLLRQALQDRILHLSLVGTVEALERVSRVQGIHLKKGKYIYVYTTTEEPVVLQFMGSQRAGYDVATERQ